MPERATTAPTATSAASTAHAGGTRVTAGAALAVVGGTAALGLSGWIIVRTVLGDGPVPWLLGRASGLTSYLLVLMLVCTGLTLAHPWARGRGPSHSVRLAVHASLATFTLAFTTLHVVVLATDPFADVGWAGALLPFASSYRTVPVTLGVLALWAGVITGVTARLAGSLAARVWWPVHKVAVVVLVLVWAHSVLAGTDTPVLWWFYLTTGVMVLGLAVTRYAARSPADRVAELHRKTTTPSGARR